jgi:acetolactate synthase regulatory subunit
MGFTPAQQSKVEPDHRYLLLATTKTSTMQKELDEAAAQGFRVVAGSPTSGAEMVLLLERVATPPDTYQYKLLATTRTSTMEKELNETAERGFRLLPQTMIAKAQLLGAVEIVVVMERAPKTRKRYEYKLLATSRTSTLQKEVSDAETAGFKLVGLVSRGEHLVIMEREAEAR